VWIPIRTRTETPSGQGSAASRPLRGHGGGNRVPCARERNEERIALRVDLVTVELFDRLAEQPRVRRQNVVVPVAELLQQPRRPFDIREEERDRSGWPLSHLDGSR
jgi:hypothetical protein